MNTVFVIALLLLLSCGQFAAARGDILYRNICLCGYRGWRWNTSPTSSPSQELPKSKPSPPLSPPPLHLPPPLPPDEGGHCPTFLNNITTTNTTTTDATKHPPQAPHLSSAKPSTKT